MKISELLREAQEQPRKKSAGPASQLPTAPRAASIDDVDSDGDEEGDGDTHGDSKHEFKSRAIGIGDGIYALSAWSYPDAWSGGGYSDMRMNAISALAADMDVQLGDYEHLSDHDMTDDRRLEVIFLNDQTDALFRLHASGANGTLEFSPSLADLQRNGMVTNAQMTKLKKIETTVRAWLNAVPEDWADEPHDRRWHSAERKVVKLFDFGGDDVDGDDDPSFSDPNHPNSRIGVDPYERGDVEAAAAARARTIERMKARKAAKLAGTQGPGRDKR